MAQKHFIVYDALNGTATARPVLASYTDDETWDFAAAFTDVQTLGEGQWK